MVHDHSKDFYNDIIVNTSKSNTDTDLINIHNIITNKQPTE